MNQTLRYFFLLFLTFFCGRIAQGVETKISGKVPSYVGKTINVYYHTHHIFEEPSLLASQKIGKDQALNLTFDIHKTQQIYLNLQTYHVYFIIAPGDSFNIELPIYNAKSNGEKYNIFYTPQRFYMAPISGDPRGINLSVSAYERMLATRFNHAINSMRTPDRDSILSLHIKELKNEIRNEDNPFLWDYKHYKTTPFYALAYPMDPQVQIDSFFTDAAPRLNNPAFWEALNGAIKNRDAIDDIDQIQHQQVLRHIKTKDFTAYRHFIQNRYGTQNEDLINLILLKDLYGLWHSETSIRTEILSALPELKQDLQLPEYKKITQELYDHLSQVYPGTAAAYYELPDKKGKLVPLKLKRKVVLLNFCSPDLQQCARDFIVLEQIKEQLGRKLEIINIVVYQEKTAFEEFAQRQKGKCRYVHWDENENLLRDFQVKGLPSFYILDPEGKFIASPAPGPDKGLKQTLETILRLY